jgi:hypothetical protein
MHPDTRIIQNNPRISAVTGLKIMITPSDK